MTPQAQLVMLLWLPLTFYLFTRFPPRSAVIMSFIGGLLFLPQRAGFKLPLIPDYQGMVATCYGIILGIIIYDSPHLLKFRLRWIDIPMICYCISPMLSSLSNNLGVYDGLNQSLEEIATWGLPYFLGRLYLNNLGGLRELAINIVKGGLLYVPLCLYEVRMSPQLHRMVYGYHQHSFAQTIRLGGFRPTVFMQHGLMVGMWMMLAALVAFWLWQARVIHSIWGISIQWLVVALLFTFILVKSSGAYVYFLGGIIIFFSAKWLKNALPLLVLIAGIYYYLFLGVTGSFNGETLVSWANNIAGEERAQSLEFRFQNEELLREKAREQMLFGWGGWGRNRIYEITKSGEIKDKAVTDSLWIIVFGDRGIFGLFSLMTAMLLPIIIFCLWSYPAATWIKPQVASVAVLAVGLSLFMLDCLVNSMFNPIFPLIGGGLSSLISQPKQALTPRRKAKRLKPKPNQRLASRPRSSS